MDLVFKGKIIKALPHKSGVSQSTGNPWEIAEYVAEQTDAQYPRKMLFQISGPDRIKNINLQEGEVVDIHFDVDAREYNGRYYNTITAFRVDRAGQQQASAQPAPQQSVQQQAPQPAQQDGGAPLPF